MLSSTLTACGPVLLLARSRCGPSTAGCKKSSPCTRHGSIKLCQDLDGQRKLSPSRQKLAVVWQCAYQIASKLKHRAQLASDQRLACGDAVQAFVPGWIEAVKLLVLVIGSELGLFRDADRALTLDIRVTTDRKDAGAGLADIAAKQQQVDEQADILDAMGLLREPHAIPYHRRIGADGLPPRLQWRLA